MIEVAIALSIVVVIGVLSGVAALVFAPRRIADDVMQQIVGDVPHSDFAKER